MNINVMTTYKGELMVDYAYPCMMAEKALKKVHDAVLSQNLDIAVEQTLIALTEARLMLTALKEMREKSTTNE